MRNRVANFRSELDYRLVHLRFDLLFEHNFAVFENLMNVRAQFASDRIDNREFLLDADGESMGFCAHGGAQLWRKNDDLSSSATRAGLSDLMIVPSTPINVTARMRRRYSG